MPLSTSIIQFLAPDETLLHFRQGYIYSLFYGLWTCLAGFGSGQASIFDSLVDTLRIVLTFFFLSSLAKGEWIKSHWGLRVLFLVAPFFFTIFEMDRSDTLAVGFILLSFLFILRSGASPSRMSCVFAGTLLSASCFTGPAIGLCGLFLSIALIWSQDGHREKLRFFLLTFLTVSLLQVAVFLFLSPRSLVLTLYHYNQVYVPKGPIVSFFLSQWRHSFMDITWVTRTTHFFLWLQLLTAVFLYRHRKDVAGYADMYRNVCKAVLLCVFMCYIFFSLQFNYLIAINYLFLVFNAVYFCKTSSRVSRGMIVLLLLINFSQAAIIQFKDAAEAFLRPKDQSQRVMEQIVSARIPRGSRVASSETYFYILERYYDVANFQYLEDISSFPYLLLSANGTGSPGRLLFPRQYPTMGAVLKNYVVLEDNRNLRCTTIGPFRVTNSAYGYGGLLLKRIDGK